MGPDLHSRAAGRHRLKSRGIKMRESGQGRVVESARRPRSTLEIGQLRAQLVARENVFEIVPEFLDRSWPKSPDGNSARVLGQTSLQTLLCVSPQIVQTWPTLSTSADFRVKVRPMRRSCPSLAPAKILTSDTSELLAPPQARGWNSGPVGNLQAPAPPNLCRLQLLPWTTVPSKPNVLWGSLSGSV